MPDGFAPGPIEFEIHLPVDDETIGRHIRSAIARGLPELREFEYPQDGPLKVIASGPSARLADLSGPTLAVNGALGLFTAQGQAPTYWAACDPQELVADFLAECPAETHYLVASKCHPKVFDRLLSLGRKVTLWHVGEDGAWDHLEGRSCILSRISITLTAIAGLMPALGWRAFETWGWDGCFMDGVHHATGQPLGEQMLVEIDVEGRTFRTTTSWALEAEDMLGSLCTSPWPPVIHGDGMFAALLAAHLDSPRSGAAHAR